MQNTKNISSGFSLTEFIEINQIEMLKDNIKTNALK